MLRAGDGAVIKPQILEMNTGFFLTTLLPGAVFLCCAASIAITDWRIMIVPDPLLLVVLAAGCAHSAAATSGGLADTAADLTIRIALLGLSGLLLVRVYRLLRRREGLGLGDVKLAAVAGAWMPVTTVLNAIAAAAIAALVIMPALAFARGDTIIMSQRIPFATFLAPAFFLAWCIGQF